nr:helix-turn-helix domain-containing protein [Streptomyces sp. NRRL F-2580]
MRYPQSGGLTAERQAFRERVRMEAVAMFTEGRGSSDVAKELRVSVRSVQRWRQAWLEAGQDGVRSQGPASRPKLSDALFAVLEEELAKGPVAHGWSDPARRAVERDETAVAGWVKDVWSHVEPPRRRSGPGSSSRTKPDSR